MTSLTIVRYGLSGLVLAACLAVTHPALAEMISLKAELKGSNEVPPNGGKGTGTVTATYDTASKKLTWKGTYSDLTGSATMAHFHGPAEPDKTAVITVPITPIKSPFEGAATLTDAQAAELMAGQWYVNVDTVAHPLGEIRGQIVKSK